MIVNASWYMPTMVICRDLHFLALGLTEYSLLLTNLLQSQSHVMFDSQSVCHDV
jgi:hypothetical protein